MDENNYIKKTFSSDCLIYLDQCREQKNSKSKLRTIFVKQGRHQYANGSGSFFNDYFGHVKYFL